MDEQKFDVDNLPEWLGRIADLDWEELSDYQRMWFENYQAFLDEEHKAQGLVVARKTGRTKELMELMAKAQREQKAELAKEMVHGMRYDAHGSKGPGVYCTCGMSKIHNRGKVLASWADRHFVRTGHLWAGEEEES